MHKEISIDTSLQLDWQKEIHRIGDFIRESLRNQLNRRGLVIAISGGIDSSVCAALAVNAIGGNKVHGLLLPETDSNSSSLEQGKFLANHLGIDYTVETMTQTLKAAGCYQKRDDAIRTVFKEYRSDWKCKITIQGGLNGELNRFHLIVEDPHGKQWESEIPLRAYLTIVAATSYKQRLRKTHEYFHADRLNYAVVGTPNRLEYDQGFFVKNGDGSADLKPIAHLYKTQVYALANFMKLPTSICNATPTTDTYSLEQGQDEFYFSLPYESMDIALWYLNTGRTEADLANKLKLSEDQAKFIYRDIAAKRKTTRYLHLPPLLIE